MCVALLVLAHNEGTLAGGFDRFDQSIDLLFDPGTVVIDVAGSFVFPSRRFETVNGVKESVKISPDTFQPSINIKFAPFANTACLASYREPFSSEVHFGSTWSQARTVVERSLKVEEIGLTCSYRLQAGTGYLRIIGGATKDFATTHEEALLTLPNTAMVRPAADLEGSAIGWRAGLGYELPSSPLRLTVMYYSPIDFTAQGAFHQLPVGPNAVLAMVPIHSSASIPQIVEATLQFPVAVNWLNAISVRWADWSVWTRIPVITSAATGPIPAGRELAAYNAFFQDGWTISNTISHQWSESLRVAMRLSWDRGVSTGWTEHTDTWSANFGATYKLTDNLELIGAVGVSLLTAGEINKKAHGGAYNATFGDDVSVSARAGLRVRY